MVKSCLFRWEKTKWMEKIQEMEKLVLYREIKSEACVRRVVNCEHRSVLVHLPEWGGGWVVYFSIPTTDRSKKTT